MVFSDRTYSVLVVSAAQKFNEAFAEMLPGSEYYPVRFVGNIAAARREMVNKTYDFVIINAPLPDDFGTRGFGAVPSLRVHRETRAPRNLDAVIRRPRSDVRRLHGRRFRHGARHRIVVFRPLKDGDVAFLHAGVQHGHHPACLR